MERSETARQISAWGHAQLRNETWHGP